MMTAEELRQNLLAEGFKLAETQVSIPVTDRQKLVASPDGAFAILVDDHIVYTARFDGTAGHLAYIAEQCLERQLEGNPYFGFTKPDCADNASPSSPR